MKLFPGRLFPIVLLFLCGLAITFIGCENDDDYEAGGGYDTVSTPEISATYSSSWIIITINNAETETAAVSYHIDLATDALFTNVVEQADFYSSNYAFMDLEDDLLYYIRVKSIADEDVESDYYTIEVTTRSMATNLCSITAVDIIDTKARIKWNESSFDSILVFRNDTLDQTAIISDDDNQNKEIIVSDLTPSRDYKVKAYYNGEYMGKRTFTTLEAEDFGTNVADLRDLSEDEAYEYLTQDFLDGLSDGATVVLGPNVKYDIAGLELSKSISFVGPYSLDGEFPVFEVEGAFDVEADADINKILFKRIKMIDHSNAKRTSSNYGGQYLLNMSNAGASVDSIIVDNCDIRYKRGVIRIKTGGISIDHITIANSFLDSIGGYGVINPSTSNVSLKSITLYQSTFAYINDFIVMAKTATLESLDVNYITTCFLPDEDGYIFDLKTQEPELISIKNSVFGAGLDNDEIMGFRSSGYSSLITTNNYRTSDCVFSSNEIEFENLYSDSYSVFADPNKLDFSVEISTLYNSAGDPRWW